MTEADAGIRLDKFIANSCLALSRTRVQQLIETGMIHLMPERVVSASIKMRVGDVVTVHIPEAVAAEPLAQEIPLEIVYEDEALLVINKPAGLVVHPAPGHPDSTLVNALLAHCGDSLSGIGGVKRPGIVHRLDKDTSGLMVVAKTDQAHQALSAQFSDRSLSRTYQALVWGVPSPKNGTIQTLIGRDPKNRQKMAVVTKNGRDAVTHYKVIQSFQVSEEARLAISLVECTLATGRTHQIRVHMRYLGCPIIGDPLYGHLPKGAKKIWADELEFVHRQLLHAISIKFIHPKTQQMINFCGNLAKDMQKILKDVEKNKKS
ncbi:RluA family pseudouridine synthase [Candidatus Paracaedibacter symbiosus]|uniref:RluA family pseudouridine synthase n=1 Tax=Candidatus Paracaedibacter symbiosus TaxID=244582 RepID=UPI000AD6CE88|nr:RluA family pseudouridine synthase [Candidatus Paracaedibacter symbiosus]